MIRSLVLAVGLLVLGAAANAHAQGAGSGVSAQDDLFVPVTTSVASGTMLTWQNDGGEQHTITADDGAFDSGTLDPGMKFGFTFDTPGRYAYYCAIHGGPNGEGMSGVIVVN